MATDAGRGASGPGAPHRLPKRGHQEAAAVTLGTGVRVPSIAVRVFTAELCLQYGQAEDFFLSEFVGGVQTLCSSPLTDNSLYHYSRAFMGQGF